MVFGVVVVLATIGDGRWWCNWICPFGTVYNLVAKVTPCKNKVGKGCQHCRKCFGAGKEKCGNMEVCKCENGGMVECENGESAEMKSL